MELSAKYKINLFQNQKFANEIRHEVLASLLIEKYISSTNLILGGDGDQGLPDLYCSNYSLGYEIVRSDLDCDLDTKLIWDAIRDCDKDYNAVKKYLLDKSFDIKSYVFEKNKNGKIISFNHIENGRAPNYLDDIYKKNIIKKLEKLSKGNYKNCKEINLAIISIARLRNNYDSKRVNLIYKDVVKKYNISFSSVYFITTEGIYIVYPHLKKVAIERYDFDFMVNKMKEFLSID